MKDILELVILVLIFIGVLALTYFVTKKIAMLNSSINKNRNIKVIEVMQLSQGQYLYIVQVGKEFHLIGSSQKGNISYCSKVDQDTLDYEERTTPGFKQQLSILMKGKKEDEEKTKESSFL